MAYPGMGATTLGLDRSMLSDERRAEIAAILRARRARLRPGQVGLPDGSRRRTPGLRREEVAALAGVSPEWYKWLEQARDVRASADALGRIAAALRLEPGATRHLLALSGYAWDGGASRARTEAITPHLQRLVERLEYCPTWVLGERWDILAWNRAAKVILGDLDARHGLERNALHVMFLSPPFRKMMVDWEASRPGHGGQGTAGPRASRGRSLVRRDREPVARA